MQIQEGDFSDDSGRGHLPESNKNGIVSNMPPFERHSLIRVSNISLDKQKQPPYPVSPLAFVTGEKIEMSIDHAALAGISFGGTYVYLIFGNCKNGEGKI